MSYKADTVGPGASTVAATSVETSASRDDAKPSTSDFVKKLFKILEDPSFQSIVCWGPLGDCFIVKDTSEFTKTILPRMFKHSNFASFVRQLNKYDFHKVKNMDDNQFGEHSWTFRHPDFHADRRDTLENIKRKIPAQRKNALAAAALAAATEQTAGESTSSASLPSNNSKANAKSSSSMPRASDCHSGSASQSYQPSLSIPSDRPPSLTRAHWTAAQQDGLMQNLIAYFLESESGKAQASTPPCSSETASSHFSLLPTERTSPTAQSPTSTSTSTAPTAKALAHQQLTQQIYAHLAAREVPSAQSFSDGSAAAALNAQIAPIQVQAKVQQTTGLELPVAMASSSSSMLSASLSDQNPFMEAYAVQQMLDTSSFSSVGLSGPGSAGYYHNQSQNSSQPSAPPPRPQDLGRATLMQMSELSRRAATAAAAGVPLPTSFSALYGGNGQRHHHHHHHQPHQSQGGQQKPSRDDVLMQIREFQRERLDQRGWSGSDGASGSILVQPSQQQQSSIWDAGGQSRSGGFGEESIQKNMEMEMDTKGRLQAQQRVTRSQGDGAALLSGDQDGDDDSPEEYVMPTQQNVGDQLPRRAPSSSSAQQQFGPQAPSVGGNNPWATMFNFGSALFPPNATDDVFNNTTDEHEGLQVYTVGHLLPRNTGGDDTQGGWTFDASGVGASSPNDSEQTYSEESEEIVRPTPSNALIAAGLSSLSPSDPSSPVSVPGGSSSQKLRVRRSTFVPGWAVPPRVLLVDDDAVSRRLSSKFLKVFGCTTDVAMDGVAAVDKMNLEKYDLVLMDIVMPKLDGVSATSLIRKFDQGTPIISMTSNSRPTEIMKYYSSGMNDILPKPFTKQGLLDMLEKHLKHLKGIQRQMNMSKLGLNALGSIPKNVGALPPLSDPNFEHAITNSARALMAESGVNSASNREGASSSSPISGTMVPSSSSSPRPISPFNFNFGLPYFPAAQQPSEEDEGRINPLAGMGLTDEQYSLILQNIVSEDGFLGGMDNLVSSSSSSSFPSSWGLGSSSTYASGDGSGFLESEANTQTPMMGMYAGDGMMMGGEKRRLEEEGKGQHDGEMKRGRYEVG